MKVSDLPKYKDEFVQLMKINGDKILGVWYKNNPALASSGPFIVNTALSSDSYYVSEEMTNLAVHASATLVENFNISQEDIPSRSGFVIFAEPIYSEPWPDGDRNIYKGAIWSVGNTPVGEPNVVVYWLVDRHHDLFVTRDNEGNIVTGAHYRQSKKPRFLPMGFNSVVADGHIRQPSMHGDDDYVNDKLNRPNYFVTYTTLQAVLKSTWLLMGQRFVTVTEQSIGRPVREKKGKTRKPPKVKVIALRKHSSKPTNNNGDSTPANFDYRFIVKGHWRMQPYGPGRKRVRPVWIAPYIKGPEDKPLRVVDKVYHLKR